MRLAPVQPALEESSCMNGSECQYGQRTDRRSHRDPLHRNRISPLELCVHYRIIINNQFDSSRCPSRYLANFTICTPTSEHIRSFQIAQQHIWTAGIANCHTISTLSPSLPIQKGGSDLRLVGALDVHDRRRV
jgi:hypothetical protein